MPQHGSRKHITFTRAEFRELLRRETKRCIHVAIENGWMSPVPQEFKFYFPTIDHRFELQQNRILVPAKTLLNEEEILPHLHREHDGWFRSEIVLSPHSLYRNATVIDVGLRDDTWVDFVLIGELSFPCEPFQLHGPALPSD